VETDSTFLRKHFRKLSDEELLAQLGSGNLAEAVRVIAADEIRVRGLQIPAIQLRTSELPTEISETFD